MTFNPVSYVVEYGIDSALQKKRHEMELLLHDDCLFWKSLALAQKSYESLKEKGKISTFRAFMRNQVHDKENYPSPTAIEEFKKCLNLYLEKNDNKYRFSSDTFSRFTNI